MQRISNRVKTTLNQCGITPSQLDTFMRDRTDWRSTCKSAVFRSRSLNGICMNLIHHPPAISSARSATGCVVHGLGFLPTTSHTRDDETHCFDDSVHIHLANQTVFWDHNTALEKTPGQLCSIWFKNITNDRLDNGLLEARDATQNQSSWRLMVCIKLCTHSGACWHWIRAVKHEASVNEWLSKV